MIRIRRVETADAAQIQRVYACTGTYSGTLQQPHPSLDMWQQRLLQNDPDKVVLVALIDGIIVGSAGLIPEKNRRRAHVASLGIGVADGFTGRGVGHALLAELLNLADNWMAVLRTELTVFADNLSAIRLYQRHGFETEGRHRAYALRNGVYCDCLAMARLHPAQPLLVKGD